VRTQRIINKDGETVEAQAPVIISASRSTDIPAFYAQWFMNRLKEGYVKWKNPFNGKLSYVTFDNTRLIIFWTKNAKPVMEHLNRLDGRNYYFQFTLNDYDTEKLEPRVPCVEERIETFQQLSERIGKDKVIWRFDPLVLTGKIGVSELLRKVENIGGRLKDHTRKLVFSFADICIYRKVRANLQRHSVPYREFDEHAMYEFAAGLQQLNRRWNFEIGTCAEKIPLENYGIIHNKCIDDSLIIKLFPDDKPLMDFLGAKITPPDMFNHNSARIISKTKENKDRGQRSLCGCAVSKDIGEYNTCPHLCEYCYANTSKEKAFDNWKLHRQNINGETITGK
jgi:DNA repair photolyase